MNRPARGNIYMFFILINQIIMIQLFSYLRNIPVLNFINNTFTIVLSQVLCFFLPFCLYLIMTRQKPFEVLLLKNPGLTNCGLIVLMCVSLQPIIMTLSAFSSFFFQNNVSTVMLEMYKQPLPIILLVLAVTPAIFEEITMRGVVLQNYRDVPIKKAAFINGLFFGIMHMDLQQFLYAFLLGIVLAYFAYYTQSILTSMLAHFTINAIQITMGRLNFRLLEEAKPEILENANNITGYEWVNLLIFLAILNAIFLPVFWIIFKSFIHFNKHRRIISFLQRPQHEIEDDSE